MGDSVAGLVLAAGAGRRLHPLTLDRPKPLCPVGGRPNLDRALEAVVRVTDAVAVNAHHHGQQVADHVAGRAHLSQEPHLMGTGGAIGHLRDWIAGRSLVVINADVLTDVDPARALAGWDGERLRFVLAGPDEPRLHPRSRLVATVLPPWAVATLPDEPCDAFSTLWRPAVAAGRAEFEVVPGTFHDCGTLVGYLDAHEWCTGSRLCVWPGAEHRVRPWMGEAVVTPTRTVLLRRTIHAGQEP